MSKRYPGGIIRKTPQTPSQTSAQGIWDMASVTQAVKENTWPIAGVPDPISKSLRFRASASAYLNRTPIILGSTTTWTWSGWIKRGALGTRQGVFVSTNAAGNDYVGFEFLANDKLALIANDNSSPERLRLETNAVFRDPSAWYHIVVFFNTTNATASNRAAIYVNGVLQTYSTATYMPQNYNGRINTTNQHNIGSWLPAAGLYFDSYLADVNFIDGQALTPSSFGSTNDQTGVWQPIVYTGTYGTNGFYLPFSNTASTTTLGYDFSGNSNNWTTNNISLTSGSTYDSMVDVPTQWIPYNTAGDTGALWRGNYSVLDPLDPTTSGNATLSNANLTLTTSAANRSRVSTIGITSGKWYAEAIFTTSSGNLSGCMLGISQAGDVGSVVGSYLGSTANSYGYNQGGDKYNNAGSSAYGASYASGDVIGIAFDCDNGTVTFYKNNVSQGTAFSSLSTSATWFIGVSGGISSASANIVINVNFGQRPFSYTPPAGFKTLCTTNLSTPTIGATATTQANDYFNVVTYSGTSATQTVSGVNFQPDFVWIKNRSNGLGFNHVLQDAVRGFTTGKKLASNLTTSEGGTNLTDNFGYVSSANSDGFVLNISGTGSYDWYQTNATGDTYVAWNWKANGSGSTNTAGSITSTVSVNTTAGFSVVTYTGSGSAATVGHGLGVAPSMIIIKDRDNGTYDWNVYHASLSSPTTLKLYLNTTDAETNGGTNSGTWNSTAPTSTVFSLGTFLNVNKSGDRFVAYCFSQVAGYSAFGKYTGNGSTDGPFVFTGFRPKYVLIKASSTTGDWWLEDTTRNPYNAADLVLFPNTSGAESGSGVYYWDFLSNGFKLRSTSTGYNGSGTTYIYAAFAESPFKYALAR